MGGVTPHTPKRKIVRRLLVHGMCDFENEIKTAVRDYIADFFNAHSFKAFLLTVYAYSKTEHEPQGGEPLLKRRCGESNKQSLLLGAALVLAITNRASPLYSQNKTGKNSNRNSVRVLAW